MLVFAAMVSPMSEKMHNSKVHGEIADMREKLRIGVLVDSYEINNWAFKMLERIAGFEYIEIAVVIKKNQDKVLKDPFGKRLIRFINRNLVYVFMLRFTNFFLNRSSAFKIRDLRTLGVGEILVVAPVTRQFSDVYTTSDVLKIKEKNLDVLIRLGSRILRGEILSCSKHGVWSLHHGDNDLYRGTPPGFWETFEDKKVIGSILQILTENLDGGIILYKSYTANDSLKPSKNIDKLYWKSSYFFDRALKDLYVLGDKAFYEQVSKRNAIPTFYSRKMFTTPNNFKTLKLIIRLFLNFFSKQFSSFFYFEQWILLFKIDKKDSNNFFSFFRYKRILPPKNRFWADPFVVRQGDKHYLFIEEFVYKENKGNITLIVLDNEGRVEHTKKILERPYHISYPFVFLHENEYYMIPETRQNKTIELYKCTHFPDKWEHVMDLMSDIEAVDTTILHHNDKWWLFSNISIDSGFSNCDELYLFYADELLTTHWTPHPKNPIVSDVRSARPAGKIFKYNEGLFRPSQNCAKRYGHGITITKINELNEKNYSEEIVKKIYPTWDDKILATHTLNFEERIAIMDGLLKRPKFKFLRLLSMSRVNG